MALSSSLLHLPLSKPFLSPPRRQHFFRLSIPSDLSLQTDVVANSSVAASRGSSTVLSARAAASSSSAAAVVVSSSPHSSSILTSSIEKDEECREEEVFEAVNIAEDVTQVLLLLPLLQTYYASFEM